MEKKTTTVLKCLWIQMETQNLIMTCVIMYVLKFEYSSLILKVGTFDHRKKNLSYLGIQMISARYNKGLY